VTQKRGNIIILAAPSGAGKSTLAHRLLKDIDRIRFSVSATTRPPRPGEQQGVDYHFLSPEAFRQKVDQGAFLEWEEFYNGTRYGTLRSDVENQRDKGYFVLLDIDVLGAGTIKRIYGAQALSIFIKPPSLEELERRLRERGTENEETLRSRLERAREELSYQNRFDCVVVNDDLETAYGELREHVLAFMKRSD